LRKSPPDRYEELKSAAQSVLNECYIDTCTIQTMVLITGSSIPISIEIIAYVYLAIGFVSALYIIYDICLRRHYQMMSIINVLWLITAWYLGPLALWSYRTPEYEDPKRESNSGNGSFVKITFFESSYYNNS
jgi:hypothetical protein